jgi:membrane-associated protease RseP (regulator of RpoE activity)
MDEDIRNIEHETNAAKGSIKKPRLAIWLFAITLVSTFWAGLTAWEPVLILGRIFEEGSFHVFRRCLLDNWYIAFQFCGGLLAILLTHEFGHYLMMRKHGIPSTFPLFIPYPFNPFGTCGALIMMDSSSANRRQIFDIGIAGPLAGLCVAIPLAILGLSLENPTRFVQETSLQLGQPLLILWLDQWLGTSFLANQSAVSASLVHPLTMAAWIGLLITGLNMMPFSQLDGGHVAYGILGAESRYLSWATMLGVGIFVAWTRYFLYLPMIILILIIGLNHPPSREPNMPLGNLRTIVGSISLILPIICVPPFPFL